MKYKIIPLGDLKNGMLVWNNGHQFVVSDVRTIDGVIRYTGRCTKHPNNEAIRGTTYDGGTYGGTPELMVSIWEA